jgi:hypothetical protein
MLRNDGKYKIYMIRHLAEVGAFGRDKSEWHFSNFDHFGTPIGFSASGDCWQETGIHGTFDLETGLEGLRWIADKHRGTKFRLVKLTLTRQTETISSMRLPGNGLRRKLA